MVAVISQPTYLKRAFSSFSAAIERRTGTPSHSLPHWRSLVKNPFDVRGFLGLVADMRKRGLASHEILSARAHWWANFSTWRNETKQTDRPYAENEPLAVAKKTAFETRNFQGIGGLKFTSPEFAELPSFLHAMIQGRAVVEQGGLKLYHSHDWGPIDFNRLNRGLSAYVQENGLAELLRDYAFLSGRFDVDASEVRSALGANFEKFGWRSLPDWKEVHWERHNRRPEGPREFKHDESARTPLGRVLRVMEDADFPHSLPVRRVTQDDAFDLKGPFQENTFFKFLCDHWDQFEDEGQVPLFKKRSLNTKDFHAIFQVHLTQAPFVSYQVLRRAAAAARRQGQTEIEARILHYLAVSARDQAYPQASTAIWWRSGEVFSKIDASLGFHAKTDAVRGFFYAGRKAMLRGQRDKARHWYHCAELLGYALSLKSSELKEFGEAVDYPEKTI